MDGTGKLFEPLQRALPNHINYEILPLSTLKADSPSLQAKEIAEKLKNDKLIIFAESYSGLIAYELCKISNLNIKHVFFAASFLTRPSQISRFANYIPLSILRKNLIPKRLLCWLLFGSSKHIHLINLFRNALGFVTDSTLKSRLKEISSISSPITSINVPCTYLQATNDKLVSKKATSTFKNVCTNLSIKPIEGGHFIAQCNPEECWNTINAVISQNK